MILKKLLLTAEEEGGVAVGPVNDGTRNTSIQSEPYAPVSSSSAYYTFGQNNRRIEWTHDNNCCMVCQWASGSIYVSIYERNSSGAMVLFQTVVQNLAGSMDGATISKDGLVLALGMSSANSGRGYVKVYTRSALGDSFSSWVYCNSPELNTALDQHYYGYGLSLSADGSTLAIGAKQLRLNGIDEGAVFVARTSNNWANTTGITFDNAYNVYSNTQGNNTGKHFRALDQSNGNEFGHNLMLSDDGNTIVVGDRNQNNSQIWEYDSSTSRWEHRIKLNSTPSNIGDQIPVAISGDGSVVAYGEPTRNSSGFTNNGYIRVYYKYDPTQGWVSGNYTSTSIYGGQEDGRFGHSLSLNYDGNYLLVGAPVDHDQGGQGTEGGMAYQYIRQGPGNPYYKLHEVEKPSWWSSGDWWGACVGISPDGSCIAVLSRNEPSYGYGRIVFYNDTITQSQAGQTAYTFTGTKQIDNMVCNTSSGKQAVRFKTDTQNQGFGLISSSLNSFDYAYAVTSGETIASVNIDPSDNIYVLLYVSTGKYGILKLNSSGTVQWYRTYEETTWAYWYATALASDGTNLWVTGWGRHNNYYTGSHTWVWRIASSDGTFYWGNGRAGNNHGGYRNSSASSYADTDRARMQYNFGDSEQLFVMEGTDTGNGFTVANRSPLGLNSSNEIQSIVEHYTLSFYGSGANNSTKFIFNRQHDNTTNGQFFLRAGTIRNYQSKDFPYIFVMDDDFVTTSWGSDARACSFEVTNPIGSYSIYGAFSKTSSENYPVFFYMNGYLGRYRGCTTSSTTNDWQLLVLGITPYGMTMRETDDKVVLYGKNGSDKGMLFVQDRAGTAGISGNVTTYSASGISTNDTSTPGSRQKNRGAVGFSYQNVGPGVTEATPSNPTLTSVSP